MKRLWIITLSVLALVIAAISVWWGCSRPRAGELYSQYKEQPGVRVGYVKDFRFDDSTTVDVTTVEALDDDGWAWMQGEFGLDAIADSCREGVLSMQRPDDGRFLFLDYGSRAICLVDIDSDDEYSSILMYHLQKLQR